MNDSKLLILNSGSKIHFEYNILTMILQVVSSGRVRLI